MNGKRVGIYLRVSTDDQTVENQRQALLAACEARGWRVVDEYIDHGISGPRVGKGGRISIDCLRMSHGAGLMSSPLGASIASVVACSPRWLPG
jgi:hypothetical protein